MTRISYSTSLVGSIIPQKPNTMSRAEEDLVNGLKVATLTKDKTLTGETTLDLGVVAIETGDKEVEDTIEETDRVTKENMLTMMIQITTKREGPHNLNLIGMLLITVIFLVDSFFQDYHIIKQNSNITFYQHQINCITMICIILSNHFNIT